jgi:hypothetical protein
MTQTTNALNLKNIVDDFRLLADRHKQINSYGFGDLGQTKPPIIRIYT